MNVDFDVLHRREGTACSKWDGRKEVFGTEDVLPLWIADMDFAAPEVVVDAIKAQAERRIFGYPLRARGVHQAFAAWMLQRHGWTMDPDWVLEVPGVVPLLALAVQTFTAPGDEVVILTYCSLDEGEVRSHKPTVVLVDKKNRPLKAKPASRK